jgi:hypothetical protein
VLLTREGWVGAWGDVERDRRVQDIRQTILSPAHRAQRNVCPTSCSCVKGRRGTEMDIKIHEPTSQGMCPGSSGGCLNSAWSRTCSAVQGWAEGWLTRLALGAENWFGLQRVCTVLEPGISWLGTDAKR